MKKTLALLIVMLSSLSTYAALPPAAESLRRMSAIIESDAVYTALGSAQWVSSIQEIKPGAYNVTTNLCVLKVNVTAVQSNPPVMVPKLEVSLVDISCTP